jgi:hypothetical protein
MLTTQEKGRREDGERVSGGSRTFATRASARVEERPGIRVEMSLGGLGRKEFPFTVAMYDGQRVGGQNVRLQSTRNAPSSSGFSVLCPPADQLIPVELRASACHDGRMVR